MNYQSFHFKTCPLVVSHAFVSGRISCLLVDYSSRSCIKALDKKFRLQVDSIACVFEEAVHQSFTICWKIILIQMKHVSAISDLEMETHQTSQIWTTSLALMQVVSAVSAIIVEGELACASTVSDDSHCPNVSGCAC